MQQLLQQQDKSDQLNELLEQYSRKGLPKMPDLLTLGRPVYDKEGFRLEKHWTMVVSDEHSQALGKHGRDQQEALWELMVTEVEYIEKLQVITDVSSYISNMVIVLMMVIMMMVVVVMMKVVVVMMKVVVMIFVSLAALCLLLDKSTE